MDNATQARLALCLDYHDAASPTEADVRALWRAYRALEVERAQARERLAAAEQARDDLLSDRAAWERHEGALEQLVERHRTARIAAEQRATRLETRARGAGGVMLEDTTRARLDDYLSPDWPPTRGTQEVVHREDLTALLTAYDALEHERDALQAHLEEGLRMMTALQAERDQAAPVLAAAAAWRREYDEFLTQPAGVDLPTLEAGIQTLVEAVDAWRAAREVVAEPCPACGGELYDQIVRDPRTGRPICPHCRADVSATDDDDDEESPPPKAGGGLT